MNRVMIPQLWGTEYRVLGTRALLSRASLKNVIASEGSSTSTPKRNNLLVMTRGLLRLPGVARRAKSGRFAPSAFAKATADRRNDEERAKHKLWLSSFLVALIAVLGLLAFPNIAWADPHATFFTDRAQEQLFFNVLAALNQADYVEPPDTPPLESDRRLGRFFRTGIAEPPPNPRTVIRDQFGNPQQVIPAPEPSEQSGVELPRIRVRQVTSDDGDVFYRERVERRALAEEMRVLIARLSCRSAEMIFGPTEARANDYCRARPDVLPLPPAP